MKCLVHKDVPYFPEFKNIRKLIGLMAVGDENNISITECTDDMGFSQSKTTRYRLLRICYQI
jgi:hypothetical protein